MISSFLFLPSMTHVAVDGGVGTLFPTDGVGSAAEHAGHRGVAIVAIRCPEVAISEARLRNRVSTGTGVHCSHKSSDHAHPERQFEASRRNSSSEF